MVYLFVRCHVMVSEGPVILVVVCDSRRVVAFFIDLRLMPAILSSVVSFLKTFTIVFFTFIPFQGIESVTASIPIPSHSTKNIGDGHLLRHTIDILVGLIHENTTCSCVFQVTGVNDCCVAASTMK